MPKSQAEIICDTLMTNVVTENLCTRELHGHGGQTYLLEER